jgi:hypothetical protein
MNRVGDTRRIPAVAGRRTAPNRIELRTFLCFKRRSAPDVWRVIGPIHRIVARYLLRAAATSRPS